MPYARSSIPDFEIANTLYIGARVTFYTVDVNGQPTTTLANLFANTTGNSLLPNPQILDSFGKFVVPVYIDAPVIGHIETIPVSIPAHNTGIISNPGRVRGAYVTGTLYYDNDLIQDSGTGIVYYAAVTFLSTNLAADITAGNLVVFLTPPDLIAAIKAAAQAAAAAASATAAASSATTAATSATTAGASATAAATSATGAASSASAAASSASSAAAAATTAVSASIFPRGRLTLSSTLPVMTGDITSAAQIYYLPYIGNVAPVYNGSNFTLENFGTGVSLNLDNNAGHTGYHQANNLFDVFMYDSASVATLGTGPAWSSLTSRGTGAGTTELQQLNGIWTNKNSINLKVDTTGTLVTVAANKATYLGTFYTTADGQTGMQFKPTALPGGSNPILGVWNAYNRLLTNSVCLDSATNWVYATGTWRASDANFNNRVSFVDGLGQSPLLTFMEQLLTVASGNVAIGITLDSIVTAPDISALTTNTQHLHTTNNFPPQFGFHFAQGMEIAQGGSTTLSGDGSLRIALSMEM